ncbi:MAG: ferritin-like domain-containing protein [Myxococcota bacterium]
MEHARLLNAELSSGGMLDEYQGLCSALERTRYDPELKFEVEAHPPDLVERVIEQWRARMVLEHRSSTVFSQLAHQLYEANASLDAKVVMLRMAQDELRHTATCAEVIEGLGGESTVPIVAEIQPLARHEGVSPEERALRNVIYTTCCSEMVACASFVDTLDTIEDPFLRQAYRRLLADEVLHARFGFFYLEAWQRWLEERSQVRRSLRRFCTHAFSRFEAELVPPRSSVRLAAPELGLPEPERVREVFYATVEGAIIPGLERLGIDAEAAWKERRRLDSKEN